MDDSAARVESLSGRFLGYPYIANTLIGSADTPEVFVDTPKGFDCVTYVETVLAHAYARQPAEFPAVLKKLRYKDGTVNWRRRNHYMTDWIRNNSGSGLVQRVGQRESTNRKERLLNVVPGLPSRKQRFSCIPKRLVLRLADEIRSGDIIFFASTRPHLDVFHCGIVIRSNGKLLLRHASRSRGCVVEQDLASFLQQNRMAGVLLARPVERSGA